MMGYGEACFIRRDDAVQTANAEIFKHTLTAFVSVPKTNVCHDTMFHATLGKSLAKPLLYSLVNGKIMRYLCFE